MAFLKGISFGRLVERFGQSFKRFPVAMLFILAVTCVLIYFNHGGKVSDNMEFFLVFYPVTGSMLAVALSLLTEDFKSWRVAVAVQAVVHALWFVISVYLARIDRFSLPQIIGVSATVVAIGLAVFLICFYRKHQDIPFWNFSIRTVMAMVISMVIGGALTLGLLLLVESLKMLFGIGIKDFVYADIWAVCMALLAPVLFLNLIPKGANKYLTEVPVFSRFAKGVVQYLFLPLLGLYMVTLYAYATMILIDWMLPTGGVSYLVTGSMVLMVLLIYLTYPIQHLEGNKLFKRVTRWLPVLMLPLLALMTVAIWRRLSDYGITVSRLYLLVFNVWCYAVCLWLIFTRNKRIWLIPASFAVILFLISVGPQSIPNITQRQLKKEAKNAFIASGLSQFPLSGNQYEKWLQSADHKAADAIDSKLDYLRRDYGYSTISDLLEKDAVVGVFCKRDEVFESNKADTYYNDHLIKDVALPQGYSKMTKVEFYGDDLVFGKDNRLTVEVSDGHDATYQFVLDFREFVAHDKERNQTQEAEPIIIDNGKELLIIDEYNLNSYGATNYVTFLGILFTK